VLATCSLLTLGSEIIYGPIDLFPRHGICEDLQALLSSVASRTIYLCSMGCKPVLWEDVRMTGYSTLSNHAYVLGHTAKEASVVRCADMRQGRVSRRGAALPRLLGEPRSKTHRRCDYCSTHNAIDDEL
jgi:hypothetical protein